MHFFQNFWRASYVVIPEDDITRIDMTYGHTENIYKSMVIFNVPRTVLLNYRTIHFKMVYVYTSIYLIRVHAFNVSLDITFIFPRININSGSVFSCS